MTIPAWLTLTEFKEDVLRQKHRDAFLQQGLPTSKNERWKYANLSWLTTQSFVPAECLQEKEKQDAIFSLIAKHKEQHPEHIFLVLVNGYFMPVFSDLEKIPQNMIACSMQQALKQYADLVNTYSKKDINAHHHPFASLNAAQYQDGLFLYLPDNETLTAPLHLLFIACGSDAFITHPHHLIVLGKDCKLTLIEDYVSLDAKPYFMNTVSNIIVGKNAQLEQYKIQNESKEAIHLAATFIEQQENTQVACLQFSSGSHFARDDLIVALQGQGAQCHTYGFYQLNEDKQYLDHHIEILHLAPHTSSNMLYKGILDKKSCAVFNGRLYVEKNAQKILAHQANHNLLLSAAAEINSKPELEIYADDVKCKHGATTGQIDKQALFYLCSRGIPREKAQRLLLKGFADDIFQRIERKDIKTRLQEMML